MSGQIQEGQDKTQRELAGILGDIAKLREDIKPKHILGHVLPDGRVVLANGHIVDGVRGVPTPGLVALPPPSATATHVRGKVLPDGTVMADGAVVDGVRGAMTTVPTENVGAETMKDMEQDRKLGTLADRGKSACQRSQNVNT